ncbi:MAG: hydrogenobyrinic acid a,c-diamide synthase (glutamine-hydrolyzing), partial [Deltaproteobacteria bacterium]|nr:hydrogenobyrinic acid a,c-diamide synthase (glutamine-hydrolyzing) [Deltaproteobacteria bacterium]
RNLDPFLMTEEVMLASFQQACKGSDIAVIEGAMGLFDGPESSGWGSTAHLARLLKLPVILVVDCTRMTGSIAAMVSGYQHFQSDVHIAGVILNNVSGPRHERKLKTAVEQHCHIPVVGSIPRSPDLNMTQRHLGHVPFPENDGAEPVIGRICSVIESHLDLDAVLNIAGIQNPDRAQHVNCSPDVPKKVKIGIIRDRVFNFYYPENLGALSQAGAELVYINSIEDRLPKIDGLHIGGGFPEYFLEELEANNKLRTDIAKAIEDGLPVYAECAGLMYLCKAINWQGQRHEMVGAIPAEIELSKRPQGHGYVEAELSGENPLFPVGMTLRGHEFHHSKLIEPDKLEFAYRVRRGHGAGEGVDGIVYKNVFAAYTHLHALGTPQWAEAFVELVLRERKSQPLVSSLL